MNIINMVAVRAERDAIRQTIAQYPYLADKQSTPTEWEALLETKPMAQTNNERQSKLRGKKKDEGIARMTIWVPETTREALKAKYPGERGGIDWEAVMMVALRMG